MEQEAQTRVLPAPPDGTGPQGTGPVPGTGSGSGGAAPRAARSQGDLAASAPVGRAIAKPPSTVGRYALVRRLAHGGMATVYLGRVHGAAGFEKVVALKLIHPHLANEPDFLEMFLDEARIAARIQNPHVVEILDLGEDEGMHYIAMEWVEGETLAALVRALRPGRLPVPVILQVIADALEGLAAAHRLNDASGQALHLVHRDVSPQNLLISMDGFVKVTDFGIMKAAGSHGSTRTGELRGKVAYMSPEQARGKALDARSDLFAVGIIAWELLHGRRLFAQSNDAATLERVTACEVPEVEAEVLAQCDDALAQSIRGWVAKALQKDPEARFEDARSMLDELRTSLRLASERDPRASLAAVMKAEFSERVAYVRASLRGMTPATQPMASLPAHDEPLSSPSISTTAAHSMSAGVTEATGLGTPERAWAALILLPLLGAAAAVGIAYAAGLGRAPASPAPAKVEAAAEVRWFVSTEPEGATVIVDGVAHTQLTPTEVILPRNDSDVTLELRVAGMKTTRATLRPLGDDNLFYRLVPETTKLAEPDPPTDAEDSEGSTGETGAEASTASATGNGPGPGTGAPSGTHIKKKFRPPGGKRLAGTGKATDDDPKDSGGTGLRPMPDFDEEGSSR